MAGRNQLNALRKYSKDEFFRLGGEKLRTHAYRLKQDRWALYLPSFERYGGSVYLIFLPSFHIPMNLETFLNVSEDWVRAHIESFRGVAGYVIPMNMAQEMGGLEDLRKKVRSLGESNLKLALPGVFGNEVDGIQRFSPTSKGPV
jgi:hypothetical protein